MPWTQPSPPPWKPELMPLFHNFRKTGVMRRGGEVRHIYVSKCGNFVLHLEQQMRPQDPRFGCTCAKCAEEDHAKRRRRAD